MDYGKMTNEELQSIINKCIAAMKSKEKKTVYVIETDSSITYYKDLEHCMSSLIENIEDISENEESVNLDFSCKEKDICINEYDKHDDWWIVLKD